MSEDSETTSGYEVFLGLDVGKDTHHAVALDRAGKRLHDNPRTRLD